jgi:hypothetical protein
MVGEPLAEFSASGAGDLLGELLDARVERLSGFDDGRHRRDGLRHRLSLSAPNLRV